MNINLNVSLEKMYQKQKQKNRTGMSMQATVNSALNLPVNNANQNQAAMPVKNVNGWGNVAQ